MTFPILGGNGAVGGYNIDNSLRFNDGDSAYLNRTPASASNRTTWTWSAWIKRSAISTGNYQTLWNAGSSASDDIRLTITNNDEIIFGTDATVFLLTSQRIRDVSAWYHIVFAFDTTQGTASDRAKLYINGSLVTDFSTDNRATLSGSYAYNNTVGHGIGRQAYSGSTYYDGYMAEINFIDGQQLSPTDFGEFDSDSGIWKPIEYTGTYGTNGYYLDFEDSGSLGADQSGNGNNFTPTNLASTDQTTDTPTNNFATLNPLTETQSVANFSEGNTQIEGNTGTQGSAKSSIQIPSSGKWYIESEFDAIGGSGANAFGFVTESYTSHSIDSSGGRGVKASYSGGAGSRVIQIMNGSSQIGSNINVSAGIIMQLVIDQDNGKAWLGKDNTYYNSSGGTDGNPSTGSNPTFTFTVENFDVLFGVYQGGGGDGIQRQKVNFGNPSFSISSGNSDENGYGNFEYAPPSGYLALCTQNLATVLSPTIDDGSEYFNTVLYTGNGSTQSITGVGFQPDWTWIKERSSTSGHEVYDSTRGATKLLSPNTTDAEGTNASALTSFDSDGFSVGSGGAVNENSQTYVGWNWKANAGSTSSNTDGSITSTVQANTTAGFSIVTYTGTGTTGTVGHGLGKVPKVLITKDRDDSFSWNVYHAGVSSDPETDYLVLEGTDAVADNVNRWNDTAPTSSVFTVASSSPANTSGNNILAYCFAEIEGYSKFGSYTGNGSSDGTFVYTGFRPAFILMKRTNTTGSWKIFDNKRPNSFNVIDVRIEADNSGAESTNSVYSIDLISNGFKLRGTSGEQNGSGDTFIYMAFAESPFVTSTSIPVTAR